MPSNKIWKNNNNSNNFLQTCTITVSIFKIGMGFPEDHYQIIKAHMSNHVKVAYSEW